MAHPDRKGRQPTPSSTPKRPSYREVTQFRGSDLQEIHQKVIGFTGVEPNPDLSRDEISVGLGLKPKEADRIDKGLDIINQLSVIGFGPADIRSVVVYEMLQDQIEVGPATGQNHYHYNITWSNPPEYKPTPQPERPQARQRRSYHGEPRNVYPEPRAGAFEEDIQREKVRVQQENRDQMSVFARMSKRINLDNIVIDPIADKAFRSIDAGFTIIGTNEEGEGVILFSAFGKNNHHEVNRSNGSIPATSPLAIPLEPGIFNIYNEVASQIEGRVSEEYKPLPLTPAICSDIYEQVLANGMLRQFQTDQGIEFGYANDPGTLLFELIQALRPDYRKVDLTNNTVIMDREERNGTRHRPIHPDFAEFLRQKKSELDSQLTK
jgi:hypothetical protein